jgi:hypothetical protein
MNWIDESRRTAFERLVHSHRHATGPVAELDRFLSDEIKGRSIEIGNERILGYEDASLAIAIATERSIAVLGLDSGEVQEEGFQVLDYSGYDSGIKLTEDWKAYVAEMNAEAELWIKDHPLGRNNGYILSSASEKEFKQLNIVAKASR